MDHPNQNPMLAAALARQLAAQNRGRPMLATIPAVVVGGGGGRMVVAGVLGHVAAHVAVPAVVVGGGAGGGRMMVAGVLGHVAEPGHVAAQQRQIANDEAIARALQAELAAEPVAQPAPAAFVPGREKPTEAQVKAYVAENIAKWKSDPSTLKPYSTLPIGYIHNDYEIAVAKARQVALKVGGAVGGGGGGGYNLPPPCVNPMGDWRALYPNQY